MSTIACQRCAVSAITRSVYDLGHESESIFTTPTRRAHDPYIRRRLRSVPCAIMRQAIFEPTIPTMPLRQTVRPTFSCTFSLGTAITASASRIVLATTYSCRPRVCRSGYHPMNSPLPQIWRHRPRQHPAVQTNCDPKVNHGISLRIPHQSFLFIDKAVLVIFDGLNLTEIDYFQIES